MAKKPLLTESGWLNASSATRPLVYLRRVVKIARTKDGRRRLRLFACACARRIVHHTSGQAFLEALQTTERFADGLATKDELERSHGYAAQCFHDLATQLHRSREEDISQEIRSAQWDGYFAAEVLCSVDWTWPAATLARTIAPRIADFVSQRIVPRQPKRWPALMDSQPREPDGAEHCLRQEKRSQAAVVRDIFHHPFRPLPVIDPAWLAWNSGTILRMAQAAYEEQQLPAGTLDAARLAVLADALEEAGGTDRDMLDHLRGPGSHVRGCWAIDLLRRHTHG